MDILRHSMQWIRGEISEMVLIAAGGLAVAAAGLAFHRFGATPLAKAMLVPLVSIGLFFGALGLAGYVNNQRRIPVFERAAREDAVAFVRAEKVRVEGFQNMYAVTNVLAPLCFAAAATLFWVTLNPRARGIAIGLVLFGLFGFLVDGFSKERADLYYAQLLEALRGST